MQIKDIINFLEDWAPSSLQEPYDNSGLILGDQTDEASAALITLDVTEAVIDEAITKDCSFIIAHHPLVFSGVKRIGKHHWVDKCIRKAIYHDISIYAIHTNLDNIISGVNHKIAEKVGLKGLQILSPKKDTLLKLTVFVPAENSTALLSALHEAGAGHIGEYEYCSFKLAGEGTFRPTDQANPTIGTRGESQNVNELRIEVMLPIHLKSSVLRAMRNAHPYEEVAYYLSQLLNSNQEVGSGIIGTLTNPMKSDEFLSHLKDCMDLNVIKHTALVKNEVSRVAVCGGSGRFLLEKAIASKADVFLSADFKYHDYFEANEEIIITDIGHYESEVFTKELIYERLTKNFAKFAFRLSEVDTNPIKYI